MTKLEECETALRKVLLEVYGIGLTGDDMSASKAVLMVLREPDKGMLSAPGELLSEDKYVSIGLAALAWPAMIDAVLDNKA